MPEWDTATQHAKGHVPQVIRRVSGVNLEDLGLLWGEVKRDFGGFTFSVRASTSANLNFQRRRLFESCYSCKVQPEDVDMPSFCRNLSDTDLDHLKNNPNHPNPTDVCH